MNPALAHSSPELRLLLSLLRRALGGTPLEPPAPSAIRWDVFLTTVERHRVGAFLHHRTAEHLAALCPDEVREHLQALAADNTRRALAQAAEQIRLTKLLEAEHIPVLTIKGLPLARTLYGDIGIRHVGDVDLMVPPNAAARADAILRATGLRRIRPDFELTPRQTARYLAANHDFEYLRESPHRRIEVLWRLDGFSDSGEVGAQTSSAILGGHPIQTLEPELNALYLFQHATRHIWFRLFWLVDIALLLRTPLDWTALMARARALGVERPLLQGGQLLEECLGLPAPAALRPWPDEVRLLAATTREAWRQIRREPQPHERLAEWTRQVAYRVQMQSRPAEKFRTLAPHLFSSESWRMWSLPDRWFFLYYPATPLLWAWRRLRRRG